MPRLRPTPALPRYPPPAEVEALWRAAGPVDGDAQVAAYLESRALDPDVVAELDLARALSPGAALPGWARGPRGWWTATGYRLLVQLLDVDGAHRSLIARSVTSSTPKSLAPAGFERRGLLLADGLGCQLLEVGGLPPWWDSDVELVVAICEGEVDYLTLATEPDVMADSGHGPAVLGTFGGGWAEEHAGRVPGGARVLLAVDDDEAGEGYAERITRSFSGREVELRRWRP